MKKYVYVMMVMLLVGMVSAMDLGDYPNMFIQDGRFNGVIVIGDHASSTEVIAANDIAVALQYMATAVRTSVDGIDSVTISKIDVGTIKLASEISDPHAMDIISVGGPCSNAVSAQLMGNPAQCNNAYSEGKGIINMYNYNGNNQLVVGGYNYDDLKKAISVLINYPDYNLDGNEVCITTATSVVKNGPCNDIVCMTLYDPVCGINGRTYSNSCYADKAGVSIKCENACPCGPDVLINMVEEYPSSSKVIVDITLDSTKSMAGFQFDLIYNPDALSINQFIGRRGNDLGDGKIRYLHLYSLQTGQKTDSFKIVFDVKSTAGKFGFNIDKVSLPDVNNDALTYEIKKSVLYNCQDSDSGNNYYEKGFAKGSNGILWTDRCQDGSRLVEASCNGKYVNFQTYTCPNGCRDGVCVEKEEDCTTDNECTLICGGIAMDSTRCVNGQCVPLECPPKECADNTIIPYLTQEVSTKSGSFSNNKGTYTYTQSIYPKKFNVEWTVSEESDVSEDPDWYLKAIQDKSTIKIDGTEAFVYKLYFSNPVKSDLNSQCKLDDLENKRITILGKQYTITRAEYTPSTKRINLDLMTGVYLDTLKEGEEKAYIVDDVEYELKVLKISDISTYTTQFQVNGETTDPLKDGDIYTLSDGTIIGVKEVIPSKPSGLAYSLVEFYLGATKLELSDVMLSNYYSGRLAINTNTISNAYVAIGLRSAPLSCGSSAELNLVSIQIAMQLDDNYYVPLGGKLSQHVTDKDDEDMLDAFDVDFYLQTLSKCSARVLFTAGGEQTIPPQPVCKDSDDGRNYYAKGITTSGPTTRIDSCTHCTGGLQGSVECSSVNEYYCSGNIIQSTIYKCSDGCRDGVCLRNDCSTRGISITKVFESNGNMAVSYTSKGGVSDVRAELSVEYLYVVDDVVEESVEEGTPSSGGSGGGSAGRVCTITSKSCGGNSGSDLISCTVYTSCAYPEYAYNKMYTVKLSDTKCTSVYDKYTLKLAQSCTDTDGGKNYYKKGTVKGCNGNAPSSCDDIVQLTDRCIIGNDFVYEGPILLEAYCDGSAGLWNRYTCPNGCKDGACIQDIEKKHFLVVDDKSPAEDVITISDVAIYLNNKYGDKHISKLNSEVTRSMLDYRVTLFVYNKRAVIIVGSHSPSDQVTLANDIGAYLRDKKGIKAPIKLSSQIKYDDLKKALENIECVGEGQKGNSLQGQVCCSGLTQVSNSWVNGEVCIAPKDGSFVCTNCGDGICGRGENKCNCVQDCPTGIYVRLDEKFTLKEKQEAKVTNHKNMKITLNNIVEECRQATYPGSESNCNAIGAQVQVEMDELCDYTSTGGSCGGVGTVFLLKEGETREVFGATLSLLDLSSNSGLFIVEKDVQQDFVDVIIEPRTESINYGEYAKYEVTVVDKHPRLVCSPGENCIDGYPVYTYQMDIGNLPFLKEYPRQVNLGAGEKTSFTLLVKPYQLVEVEQVRQRIIPQSGEVMKVARKIVDTVATGAGTIETVTEETEAQYVYQVREYQFNVKATLLGNSNVQDIAYALLRIGPEDPVDPPDFPEEEVTIKLYKGWNLISLPGKLTEFSDGECIGNRKLLGFVFLKEKQKYVTLNEAENILGDELQEYLAKNAFWIYSYDSCELKAKVDKMMSYYGINLYQGWNLVPITEDMTGGYLGDITEDCDMQNIYKWSAPNQRWDPISQDYGFGEWETSYGFIAKVADYCALGGVAIVPPEVAE